MTTLPHTSLFSVSVLNHDVLSQERVRSFYYIGITIRSYEISSTSQ
jgi:hypothetical protein